MSRIIKAQDSIDEDRCRPHLFPQLLGEESGDMMLSRAKCDDFVPGCTQTHEDSSNGEFEAFFQEKKGPSVSEPSEVDLSEKHADELKESFAKGYIDGENSGILSERQRIEPALEALQASAEELRKCGRSLIADFEKASVELAIAIAGKIVCHEISINKETIIDVLKKATKETDGSDILKIRINPSDLQFIEEAGYSLSDLGAENATLEGDSAVPGGGCVIQTDFGCVDSIIDHQLEAVAEALREKF